MICWLFDHGWTIHLTPGEVAIARRGWAGTFETLEMAYKAALAVLREERKAA